MNKFFVLFALKQKQTIYVEFVDFSPRLFLYDAIFITTHQKREKNESTEEKKENENIIFVFKECKTAVWFFKE